MKKFAQNIQETTLNTLSTQPVHSESELTIQQIDRILELIMNS